MNRVTFSVIIPVFKRLEYARQAILSVMHQTVDANSYEIILVEEKDYGETLRTQLKEEFPAVIALVNTNEEGPGGCRQTGLNNAKGTFVCFLDSDDIMHPDFLATMSHELRNDASASAAICMSQTKFEQGFNLKERLKLYPLLALRDVGLLCGYVGNKKHLIQSSFYICQISHMLFRYSSISDLVFHYDYRRGGEDWDFFVQTLTKGSIKIVARRLLTFRYSPGSSTDTKLNRERKWQSYTLLASRVPQEMRSGVFYALFLRYIKIFGGNYLK